jgi:uncharacterized protein
MVRLLLGIFLPLALPALAQDRLPILDVHLHAYAADQLGPPPLAMCTPIPEFPAWDPAGPYPPTFMALHKDPPCDDPVWSPETDAELRQQTIEAMERRNVFGILSGSPERVASWMESYWALAEELDIPVGIHIGPGPPGVHYLWADGYRAHLHSALTLEPVLVRHPKLRVYIMHAGFPMINDLLALLYAHPQVYVGVGVIERAIETIEEAPFLSDAQKRDILYNNAVRFLRLPEETIAQPRQYARENRTTTVISSSLPSSMAPASSHLATSGREEKFPAGPTTGPSPGPTLVTAVAAAESAVRNSMPNAASAMVTTTTVIPTAKI